MPAHRLACATKNIKDLVHLEAVHDVLDLYLWLSYRFMDMFPDANLIRDIQKELDSIIQLGVHNITHLIRASETSTASETTSELDDDILVLKTFVKDKVFQSERLSQGKTNLLSQKQGQRRVRGSKALGFRPTAGNSENNDGSLSSRLVQQGLLTANLLEQLQKEWSAAQEEPSGNNQTVKV
ncbi:ATP-dependent RNA helicase SUPV3L1, mitochondrial-like [Polypterus senegalus]|uniref:ATP-dependent RNA helicase SUPV3L1, mitochondrial-like n=1 Tax=Polypterus senegalus TaxID=55291 RepID=UPI0019653EEB|nr:ATP-dependent RNA helicase SUPV3L1, mitochondrial-like [Polypterus senegalus]